MSKQRQSKSLLPQWGTAKLLSPACMPPSDDPDFAWEIPRHTVEIRVKDCIADQLAHEDGLEGYYLLFSQDVLGRAYITLGLVAARRLLIVAVPAQDVHGRLWVSESLEHGDFALRVRRSSNGEAVAIYYDNTARRAQDARYDALLKDAASRPLDERPVTRAQTLGIAHHLSQGLTAKGLASNVCAVHFFMPDAYVADAPTHWCN